MKDVTEGDAVTHENVRAIRPGGGCAPSLLEGLLGKTFIKSHTTGTPMNPNLISG